MPLPKSVQQQVDNATAHFEPSENPGETPAPEESEKQSEATGTEPQSADTGKEAAEDDKRSQEPEPKPEEAKPESYWENRFNVLQGKYNAEVPALQQKVHDLESQVQQRDRQIEELKTAQSQSSSDTSGIPEEQLEKFKDEFGEDLVDFVKRMTSRDTGHNPKVDELERKVSQFEQEKRQNAEATFWTALKDLVPNYLTLNNDPAFHQFLAGFDPQTGKQRQQTLSEAQQALDAGQVAGVFKAFIDQSQQPQKPQIPEDQIDPQTSRATETPQGQTMWTRAQISQFYRDKTQGKYGRDEAQRLEADIFRAQKEGRIQ